jgi:hypothetical protein
MEQHLWGTVQEMSQQRHKKQGASWCLTLSSFDNNTAALASPAICIILSEDEIVYVESASEQNAKGEFLV